MQASLRRLALGLVFTLLAVGVLVGQAYHRGQQAMLRSDAAFDQGEVVAALEAAREAATSYLPLSPHVDQAYARMRAIALGAEARGDKLLAQSAWSAIRGALIETAHPWSLTATSGGPLLEQANQSLVRLLDSPADAPGLQLEPPKDQTHQLRAAFDRSPLPNEQVMLASTLGMLLMLTAIYLLQSRGRMQRVGFWVLSALGLCFWLFAAVFVGVGA